MSTRDKHVQTMLTVREWKRAVKAARSCGVSLREFLYHAILDGIATVEKGERELDSRDE